jgi:hypothetical protein
MSMPVAIVVLIVVLVVVGGAGYFGLQAVKPTSSSVTKCEPASSCASASTNDVTLFVPYTVGFGQTYSQIAAGNLVPATVGVSGGESIQTFAVSWAPSVTTTSSNPSLNHTYTEPGLYVISATATTGSGVVHTGLGQLVALKVNPSVTQVTLGYYPTVSFMVANTTGGSSPWIGAGGSITVTGLYTAAPTDPFYSELPPTLSAAGSGVSESGLQSTSTSVTAKYTFQDAGYYAINLTVPVSGPAVRGYPPFLNYTFSIYVGATAAGLGCASCKVPIERSPHAGTFVNYEVIPGGSESLDPAADYYTAGYEVGAEFDEGLIEYNGTDTGQNYSNFLPEVATCVPGSAQCVADYGTSLVSGNLVTFVIDPGAQFYDPSTGAHRGVYPTDVMFSFIRDVFYTNNQGTVGSYAGFDLAGPLVPQVALAPNDVNMSWDSFLGVGLHYPYNNTPQWVLPSMLVNDSAYCPAAAMTHANGCITINASADGESWPALLQILAMTSFAVQDAGWYTAQGASVPGFVCTTADAPCLLPGGATSTTQTAYINAVAAMTPTYWDAQEEVAATNYPTPVPAVTFAEVGSGPYYLAYANGGVGYTLIANPYYHQPIGCAGNPACLPAPGTYVPKVISYWEASDTVGLQEVQAGYADSAAFETIHFPLLLGLIQSGQVGLLNIPSMITDNIGFNFAVDLSSLAGFDTNPYNIPSDVFTYIGLRAVLEYSFPYVTNQAVANVVDGIYGGQAFGGFIPTTESTFYSTATPWPNYNPTTGVWSNPVISSSTEGSNAPTGSAQWYWNQAYNLTGAGGTPGPYYDPELASYSAANPLLIPDLGFTSAPQLNQVLDAWGSEVSLVTGGVVKFSQFLIPGTTEQYSNVGPGVTPWAIWFPLWVPDYPAPQNNYVGAYGPTGLWGGSDALSTLDASAYNATGCGHYGTTLANLTYWATIANNIIPQDCQGVAMNITTNMVTVATFTSGAMAVTEWDLIQDVYNNLQLTIGQDQATVIFTYAPWINPASINVNPTFGGGGELSYYSLTGNGIV